MTTKDKKKTKSSKTIYDTIIVGGGIGGLYTAYKLQQKHNEKTKTHNILLLEASKRLGGRIHSVTKDDLAFEAGASIFHDKQPKIMELIDDLNLNDKLIISSSKIKLIPTPKNKYLNNPNFHHVININNIINDISDLVEKKKITELDLINNSLLDLIETHFNKKCPDIANTFEEVYEQWSNIAIMNAKDALKLFKQDLSDKNKFYSLYGGMNQLIDQLEKVLNIDIETEYNVKSIHKQSDNTFIINNKYICRNIVFAIPKHNLLDLKYITDKKHIKTLLNSIEETPLCRIYAKYPKTILDYHTWFYRLPNTSLPGSRLKYISPINYDNGLIMISFTDGKYAKYWKRILDDKNIKLKDRIYEETLKTFPEIEEIPKPDWVTDYYWEHGFGYWKIGADSDNIIPKIIKPIDEDNIYVCGDNYSRHQTWIEGSLESSSEVIKLIK